MGEAQATMEGATGRAVLGAPARGWLAGQLWSGGTRAEATARTRGALIAAEDASRPQTTDATEEREG